ncbi:MAG: DNA polymerase III subunit delta [Candidatus Yanofskybacteria bacterium]|nr:DNA polymerase III subunit delta [Candidatus Yanofskybacteria bacterium]
MLIFLYGPDSYRLKQARDEVIQSHKSKYPSGLNFIDFDVSGGAPLDLLVDAIRSLSFFGEHKLIALKNVFSKKSQAETILRYINNYDLTTAKNVTLLVAEDGSGKELAGKLQELFGLLSSKSSLVKNIDLLQGEELEKWIQQEFRSRSCVTDSTAIRRLVGIAGNDTWRLSNEIEKLARYKDHEKITGIDVDTLVNKNIDMNIFNLIDAIAQKNKSNALKLLYQEIKTGQDPYYILTMIVYQFRNMLAVKDLHKQGYSEGEISRKTKIHPFAVKKSINNPFNSEEAAKIYGRLLSIDTGFKMGRIDLEDSLYSLVA